MSVKRIVLVDNLDIVRKGVQFLLTNEHDFDVVGEADNGKDGLSLIREVKPDLALIDLHLNGMNGPALCRAVREEGLNTSLVMFTSCTDKECIETCLQLGIQGYILKNIQGSDLVKSIRAILKGGSVLDPQATRLAIDWIEKGHHTSPNSFHLSPRDLNILRLMSRGLTNKEIGNEIHLSENTIKTHILNIFRHLEAKNRVEAVATAYRLGIL